MDWKIFAMCFGAVFLAELGDKTQLATMMFSAQVKSPWLIFAASSLALVASSLIATTVGCAAGRCLPETPIKIAAGALFLIIGAVMLYTAFAGGRAA